MKPLLTLHALLLCMPVLLCQTLDATISINAANKLVISINSPAAFEFNQTVNAASGFSLILDEVYASVPGSLTTNPISGAISYTATNGNAGNVSQMGPFGFDFGVYSIQDDELTFPSPGAAFNAGDIITIQAGTVVSNAAFPLPLPFINPGPYTAFIASDDYLSVATMQVPLPVELTKFLGTKRNDKVHLIWETASETNNEGFQVEHSKEGESWKKIAFQQGRGNSTEVNGYEYFHKYNLSGKNYYRLKQIDLDGRYDYSKVIAVNFIHQKDWIVKPNPTGGILQVEGIGEGDVLVMDASGKVVKKEKLTVQEIDISDLPAGLYFLQLFSEHTVFVERVLKNDY